MLGAGGAARAAAAALAGRGRWRWPSRRAGARRRPSWPLRWARRRRRGRRSGRPALVVNATPIGQSGDAGELPAGERLLREAQVVCDLAYRGDGRETGLVSTARAGGARVVDGLDVLVGQGVHAFRLLTGREPPADVMRAAVRANPHVD